MSSLFSKIPPEISPSLPWNAISELFGKEPGINKLEDKLGLKRGTLAKAQREYPAAGESAARGISAKVHSKLLEEIFQHFATSDIAKRWMQDHWPPKLLKEYGTALEIYYQNVDTQNRLLQMGTYPPDYVACNEQAIITDLLLNNRKSKIIWITGPGGIGKTTLVTGILRHNQQELNQQYANIFWINIDEHARYEEGIKKIAGQLSMIGQSATAIEQKILALGKTSRLLLVLDASHDIADWEEWKKLAGYLGTMIVCSRLQLPYHELSSDKEIHQIELNGFSKMESLQFLGKGAEVIEPIFSITGGYPLALRLLKGQLRNYSADEIVSDLLSAPFDTMQEQTGELTRKNSLRACFNLTWRLLSEESPIAKRYFESIGAFRSHTIPREMLKQVGGPESARQALDTLRKHNLIDLENHNIVQIHALLHEYARERLAESQDAGKISGNYRRQLQEKLAQWDERLLRDGKLQPETNWLMSDIEQFARVFLEQVPEVEMPKVAKNLFNLLFTNAKTHLLDGWLDYLEQQPGNLWSRAYVRNLRGRHEIDRANIRGAASHFIGAIKILEGVDSDSEQHKQNLLIERANSILGLAHCLLYANKNEVALELLRSPEIIQVFCALTSDDFLQLDKDLLLAETLLANEDWDALQQSLSLSRRSKLARESLYYKTKVAKLRAAYYHQRNDLPRAARIYRCIFQNHEIAPILRCEAGLGLAACEGEMQQYQQAQKVLKEVDENLLPKQPKLQARFWKQTALNAYCQQEYQEALSAAKKSQNYWEQVPGPDKEKREIQDLLGKIRSKIFPQK